MCFDYCRRVMLLLGCSGWQEEQNNPRERPKKIEESWSEQKEDEGNVCRCIACCADNIGGAKRAKKNEIKENPVSYFYFVQIYENLPNMEEQYIMEKQ